MKKKACAKRSYPVAFLDRDGVINAFPGQHRYVCGLKDFHMLPGAAEGVRRLNRGGFRVVVISNQAGVSKGLYSRQTLDELTRVMLDRLGKKGAFVDGVYYCIHRSEANCRCRKPATGLIRRAVLELRGKGFSPDLSRSVFIGDSMIDMNTARAAKLVSILVFSGRETPENSSQWEAVPDYTAGNLKEAAAIACSLIRKGKRG